MPGRRIASGRAVLAGKQKSFHRSCESNVSRLSRLATAMYPAFARRFFRPLRFCAVFLQIGGDAASAILKVKQCVLNQEMAAAADELEQLIFSLSETGYKDNIAVNFSIANNADYYNGLIFNGYIDGVPKRVLSGGRYDKLLQKLGKTGGAIGFALYLGELESFFKPVGNAVDVLILYDDDSMLEALKSSKHMADGGGAVRISRTVPDDIGYGKIVDMRSKSK